MEGEEPPRLAGQSLRDLRWAFEQALGADVVARALASVSPEAREAYAGATPMSWVPYATVVEVHTAIAREAGTTMEAILEHAVPLAVERSFRTVWRVLFRFTSDEALIARAPLLYSKTRSKGAMSARVVARGRAVAEVSGWRDMPPRDVLALGISIRALVSLAGREDVTVRGERTAGGAEYTIRWRV